MIDISDKQDTNRVAVAKGKIFMKPQTLEMIKNKSIPKGDVLNTAICAGIMAAKRTAELMPMCHPLMITSCNIDFSFGEQELEVMATVKVYAKTGVEMEALTAVSIACLCVYDMCKGIDKDMVISDIMLISKSGGQSGIWTRG